MALARYLANKFLVCALFGFAYLATYDISVSFHLVDSFAPGISLIFIPAGVKLVAALVSGFWGVLGTVIALTYAAPEFWADQPLWFYPLYGALSGFTTLFAVRLMKRLLRIEDDLSNLRLLQLPVIDLFSTLCHGFVVNVFFILCNLSTGPDLLLRATGMAVGDFVGGMILLVGLAIVLKLTETWRSKQAVIDD